MKSKMSAMSGLLLLGMLCLAAHAADDPAPEAPAATAASANITAGATGWWPVAHTDVYKLLAPKGEPFHAVLEVLNNDFPGPRPDGAHEIIITGVTTISGNYGGITMTKYHLEYDIKRYDGRKVIDTFRYTVANRGDLSKTSTAAVKVRVDLLPLPSPSPAPISPLFPKADDFWFKVATAGSTVTKQLDVLANDREGQVNGTELQIMGLDTSAPLTGTPSISADKKSITYTVPRYSGRDINDRFWYNVTNNGGKTEKKARVVVRVRYDPPLVATNDLYSVTPPNDVAGVRFSNVLDVLSNDRGNGAVRVVSAAPYPLGATLQGSVQPTADQRGILYTATYYGSPYVETFSYSIFDAREQSAFATVKVAVGRPVPMIQARDDKYQFELAVGSTDSNWVLRVMDNDLKTMAGGGYIDSVAFRKPASDMQGNATITATMPDGTQGIEYRLAKPFDGTTFTYKFKYLLCGFPPINECNTALVDVEIKGPREQWVAIADNYSLALDINGNLPPTVLDVLANDQGRGLKLVGYRQSSTEGYLAMDNNKFLYQVMQYRGPSYTMTINYTNEDERKEQHSTTATVNVAAPFIEPQLQDDTVNGISPSGLTYTLPVDVLKNDLPAGGLRLLRVERFRGNWGNLTVDSTGSYLIYSLYTDSFAPTTITDQYRYVATTKGVGGAEYRAYVTINTAITSK
ncbi:hypothetical protein OEZ85_002663 [Tetradesmus obliquus]|uniref:Cadherin domain-containing protein n=1 Tax=Tetradesmus obliquus TaxID=3088 RepID=A0ABY8TZ22_TETOB|nr:hypothetical protein OEZ85_002663 [Tetradesmus obliquus]